MPRVTTPWCAEEIALLKEMHGNVPTQDIAYFLGRSKASVACMQYSLGLSRSYRAWRSWTAEDLSFIVKNHRSLTNQQIADRLGRSRGAVRAQIRDLRLSGQSGSFPPWTEAEETYLLLAWPTDSLKDIGEALGRSVCAVTLRALNVLKIRRPPSYYLSINRPDLLLPRDLREVMALNRLLKKGLSDAEHRRSADASLRGARGAARKSDGG